MPYSQYRDAYQSTADAAADKYGIPRNIFSAMIEKESGWNPYATGTGSTAYGFGQLTHAAAQDVGANAYDPTSNLYGSAAYLASMPGAAEGDWSRALGSYNQGAGGYAGAGKAAGDAYAADVMRRAGASGGAVGEGGFSVGFMDGASEAAGASSGAPGGDSAGSIAGAISGAGEKISGALGGLGDTIAAPFKAVGEFFATLARAFTGEFWSKAWDWIKSQFLIIAVLIAALVLFTSGAFRVVKAEG